MTESSSLSVVGVAVLWLVVGAAVGAGGGGGWGGVSAGAGERLRSLGSSAVAGSGKSCWDVEAGEVAAASVVDVVGWLVGAGSLAWGASLLASGWGGVVVAVSAGSGGPSGAVSVGAGSSSACGGDGGLVLRLERRRPDMVAWGAWGWESGCVRVDWRRGGAAFCEVWSCGCVSCGSRGGWLGGFVGLCELLCAGVCCVWGLGGKLFWCVGVSRASGGVVVGVWLVFGGRDFGGKRCSVLASRCVVVLGRRRGFGVKSRVGGCMWCVGGKMGCVWGGGRDFGGEASLARRLGVVVLGDGEVSGGSRRVATCAWRGGGGV